MFKKPFVTTGIVCLLTVLGTGLPARADILGFGDFSNFTLNQADTSPAPSINGGTIQLTSTLSDETRTLFYDTPQPISQFDASFIYQTGANQGSGATLGAFVIQNGPAGAEADTNLLSSAIITLNLPSASGLHQGPGYTGAGPSTVPVVLNSGDPIDVSLSYNGSLLHETLLDTTTSASYSTSYLVNIPSIVGGPDAYVGVLGYTGDFSADQYFSSFTFHPTPEPASWVLAALGMLGLLSIAKRKRNAIRTTAQPL